MGSKTAVVLLLIGLFFGLVPFFVVAASTMSTFSGPDTFSCTYREQGAIWGGVIAIVIGLILPAAGREWGKARFLWMALLVALGVIQLLRGFGTIGSPCPEGPQQSALTAPSAWTAYSGGPGCPLRLEMPS